MDFYCFYPKGLANTFFGKFILFITKKTFITKHSIKTGFVFQPRPVNFLILPKCSRCPMLLIILFTFFLWGFFCPGYIFPDRNDQRIGVTK